MLPSPQKNTSYYVFPSYTMKTSPQRASIPEFQNSRFSETPNSRIPEFPIFSEAPSSRLPEFSIFLRPPVPEFQKSRFLRGPQFQNSRIWNSGTGGLSKIWNFGILELGDPKKSGILEFWNWGSRKNLEFWDSGILAVPKHKDKKKSTSINNGNTYIRTQVKCLVLHFRIRDGK